MIELSAEAAELLEELKGKGVKLSLNNSNLRVEGKLPDNLKEEVRKNKEGLIQLVKLDQHAEWQFKPVQIPRLDGKSVDVWMVGTRLDNPGTFQFWFVDAQHNASERSSTS